MTEFLHQQRTVEIGVDEIDCMGRVKISALMQHMQDVATLHAETIGVGFAKLFTHNLLWVQTSMNAQILSYPKIGEKITVVTYPHFPGTVECYRDYYLYRESGEEFARAVAVWCVIDFSTRRIKKAKDLFAYEEQDYNPIFAIPTASRKFTMIEELSEAYYSAVKYTDLDRNRHMNNTYYGDVMINSCSVEKLDTQDVSSFDMNFMHELKPQASYTVFSGSDEVYHYTSVTSEGQSVFSSRFSTRPRTEGVV